MNLFLALAVAFGIISGSDVPEICEPVIWSDSYEDDPAALYAWETLMDDYGWQGDPTDGMDAIYAPGCHPVASWDVDTASDHPAGKIGG